MMNMWLRIRTFAALVKQSAIKSLSVKPVQKSKSLNLLNRSIKNRQIRSFKEPGKICKQQYGVQYMQKYE